MRVTMRLLLLAPMLLLLQGCHVPLQPYRLQHPAIAIAPPPPTGPAVKPVKTDQDCVAATVPICLAFLEVDDMGELWDKAELDTALGVIRRANTDAHADPVVLTFVHGWKNNAAPDNGNVAGFEVALQDLYASLQRSRPVIGIYIGWRGNLIRPSWPVAQQMSYYNREAAATRIHADCRTHARESPGSRRLHRTLLRRPAAGARHQRGYGERDRSGTHLRAGSRCAAGGVAGIRGQAANGGGRH